MNSLASYAAVLRSLLQIAICVAVLLAGLQLAGIYMYSSSKAAIGYLQGQACVVTPTEIDVSPTTPGQASQAVVHVQNLTDRAVMLIGAHVGCDCISTDKFPIALREHETRKLTFTIRPADGERFRRRVLLFTNQDETPELNIVITGSAEAPP